MTVLLEQLRSRSSRFEARRQEFEQRANASGGTLPRSDLWRHEYASRPYLLGCPENRLAARFRDIFINMTELNREEQIGLLPIDEGGILLRKFTHLLEEYAMRGGLPDHRAALKSIVAYFADGGPIAARIFADYVAPCRPFLVKYGSRQFLEPTLRKGALRICPASFYNDTGHNAAVRDDETSRIFYISTYRERLNGITHVDIQGHPLEYKDDDIVLPLVVPDYFLYSLCDQIYYRMPTDFGADAALIVRDPRRFVDRLISEFLARFPGWEVVKGPVTYYDPYLDYTKFRVPEMAKHFGYAYQREVRVAFRSKQSAAISLEPVFLEIGSMEDYADLLHA